MPEYPAHAGVEQRLNQQLPMQSVFTDEIVRSGPLQQWFNGKPVVMAMIYYNCLMLCPQVVRGLATGLKDTTLVPGKDYQVLNFSIDPKDKVQDAQKQKNAFLDAVGKPQMADDVHFLTSTQPGIMALSNATGFHFVMVPGPDGPGWTSLRTPA